MAFSLLRFQMWFLFLLFSSSLSLCLVRSAHELAIISIQMTNAMEMLCCTIATQSQEKLNLWKSGAKFNSFIYFFRNLFIWAPSRSILVKLWIFVDFLFFIFLISHWTQMHSGWFSPSVSFSLCSAVQSQFHHSIITNSVESISLSILFASAYLRSFLFSFFLYVFHTLPSDFGQENISKRILIWGKHFWHRHRRKF